MAQAPMHHAIMPAIPDDAPELLALQRLAYQSEARLYGDWAIPPLTKRLGYQFVDSRAVTPGLTLVFLEKPGLAQGIKHA